MIRLDHTEKWSDCGICRFNFDLTCDSLTPADCRKIQRAALRLSSFMDGLVQEKRDGRTRLPAEWHEEREHPNSVPAVGATDGPTAAEAQACLDEIWAEHNLPGSSEMIRIP